VPALVDVDVAPTVLPVDVEADLPPTLPVVATSGAGSMMHGRPFTEISLL